MYLATPISGVRVHVSQGSRRSPFVGARRPAPRPRSPVHVLPQRVRGRVNARREAGSSAEGREAGVEARNVARVRARNREAGGFELRAGGAHSAGPRSRNAGTPGDRAETATQ